MNSFLRKIIPLSIKAPSQIQESFSRGNFPGQGVREEVKIKEGCQQFLVKVILVALMDIWSFSGIKA